MFDGGLYEDKKQIALFLGKLEHWKKRRKENDQMKEEKIYGIFYERN